MSGSSSITCALEHKSIADHRDFTVQDSIQGEADVEQEEANF